MSRLEPGTVFGGRYAVEHLLSEHDGATRWVAADMTLHRGVTLLTLDAEHPYASSVLDGGRRAAGVDNRRLTRILDVGTDHGSIFVVEEANSGAQTLAALLRRGALPPREARRIVGEAATGIEAARRRGLHHLRLGPRSVLRGADGQVKIVGLGTAGALAGDDGITDEEASRIDTIGLVALAYAALTRQWPLDVPKDPGLPRATRVGRTVASPSEVTPDVPADLDAICRLTLNHGEPPSSPGDFAAQIAPWSPVPIDLPEALLNDQTQVMPPVAPTRSGSGGPTPPHRVVEDTTPTTLTPTVRGDEVAGAGAPGAAEATGSASAAAGSATTGAGATTGAAAAMAALANAADALTVAGNAATDRLGGWVHSVVERANGRRAARAAERDAAATADFADGSDGFPEGSTSAFGLSQSSGGRDFADDPAFDSEPEPDETLFLPDSERLDSSQTKLALGIVAVIVAAALVFGIYGVSRMGSKSQLPDLLSDKPAVTQPTTTPPQGTSSTAPATTGTTGTTPSPTGPVAIPIKAVTALDPYGDGEERNDELPRITDGDPATFWRSEGYKVPTFHAAKKGVGIVLDLGSTLKPTELTLNLPTTSDISIHVGDRAEVEGKPVASKADAAGDVTIELPNASGRYVIVWYTKVSVLDKSWYRATLAEASVKG